jgi:glycerol-3-phosphate dehydrogenase (NAD(P)+)
MTLSPLSRVLVVGAGSWGTTVANLLAGKGLEVALWAREKDLAASIMRRGENERYLPDVMLHPHLRAVSDLEEETAAADLLVMAIPTQSLRGVASMLRAAVRPGTPLVNLAKGIEDGTGCRCSEILLQEIGPQCPIGLLTGPNIAWEVARGVPAKAVVACSSYRHLSPLRDVFSTGCFKVFESSDLAGAELAGALKNVIALMAGIGDGLGFGVNTKSAVITRGLNEMVRIGVRLGGHRDTFFGLAGAGDLMATCLSEHSRNRTFGERVGRGASTSTAEQTLAGRVAEGVKTTKAVVEMKGAFDVETPIIDTVHDILFGGMPAREGYLTMWKSSDRYEGN